MSGALMIIVLILLFCQPALFDIICALPKGKVLKEVTNNDEDPTTTATTSKKSDQTRKRRQKTFIRNPNYINANKELDALAEQMFMKKLPSPHPGAQAGSSHGCDPVTEKIEIEED